MNAHEEWVAAWTLKADNDLKAARALLEIGGPLDVVCFHAQQCAEKYLKALPNPFVPSFAID